MIGSNVTEASFAGQRFEPHDDGAFKIPESAVTQGLLAGLVVAPEPAAVPARTAQLFVGLMSETVMVDVSDLESRLRLLELSDWTRHHGIGYARFVDSAGDVHTLDKAEAVNVVAAARRAPARCLTTPPSHPSMRRDGAGGFVLGPAGCLPLSISADAIERFSVLIDPARACFLTIRARAATSSIFKTERSQ